MKKKKKNPQISISAAITLQFPKPEHELPTYFKPFSLHCSLYSQPQIRLSIRDHLIRALTLTKP